MYADDLLLLSASVAGLQAMINICCTYGNQHRLVFNTNKSVCSKFGTKWPSNTVALLLDNSCLQWVVTRQLQVSWSDVYIWRESGCRLLPY